MGQWHTIGQFSKMADVSTRTLRVYEEMGLIRSHSRGENGYRYFEDGQLEILERIKSFKGFGFTLKEIRALLIADLNMNSEKLVSFLNGRMSVLNDLEGELREQRLRIQNALRVLESKDQELKANEKMAVMENFGEFIPMITVRDFILFPGSRMPIFIGRQFTKNAVKLAVEEYSGKIVLLTQKATELNDQPTEGEFFDVGTVCEIELIKELPDGTLKVVLKANERCHIIEFLDKDSARLCRYTKLKQFHSEIPAPTKKAIYEKIESGMKESPHKIALLPDLARPSDDFHFLMRAGEAISIPKFSKHSRYKASFPPGLFLTDTYSEDENSLINAELARIQEVLTETDGERAAEKILELLKDLNRKEESA